MRPGAPLLLVLVLALCACPRERAIVRRGEPPPAPSEADALREVLRDFAARDATLGPYAAARDGALAGWRHAAARLESRLHEIWSRRSAEDAGETPAGPLDADEREATQTPLSPRCVGERCCAPSLPESQTVQTRRIGGRRVIMLDLHHDPPGPPPRPNVLWSAQRWRPDAAGLGEEVAVALEGRDDTRAALLAGLLLAEIALRQVEASFARSPGSRASAPDCADVGALVRTLSSHPAVAVRARYLGVACEVLGGQSPTPPLATRAATGAPFASHEAWRSAVEHSRAVGEPEAAIAAARRIQDDMAPRFAQVRRVFASHQAYRLDRFPDALAELAAVATSPGDAGLAEVAAGFAVTEVLGWQSAVASGVLPNGPSQTLPPSTEPGCGAPEVLGAHLRGSALLGPALRQLADAMFDATAYREAVAAYRALVAHAPTSPEVLHALRRIHEARVGERSFDDARREAESTAEFLAPGSPWARANAAAPATIAQARELVAALRGSTTVQAPNPSAMMGVVDRWSVMRAIERRATDLTACFWGGWGSQREPPLWAALDFVVLESGSVGGVSARVDHGAEGIGRCLVERARWLDLPAPEYGPVPFSVWLVAP